MLVIGAKGFAGGRLCRYLADRDIPVRAMYWPDDGVREINAARIQMVPRNLRDKCSLRAALEGIEVGTREDSISHVLNRPEPLGGYAQYRPSKFPRGGAGSPEIGG